MDVPDSELVQRLEARDGPLADNQFEHDEANCRYAEQYEGETCPWCEAVRQRRSREASGAAS